VGWADGSRVALVAAGQDVSQSRVERFEGTNLDGQDKEAEG
jgi:hypothetical protein